MALVEMEEELYLGFKQDFPVCASSECLKGLNQVAHMVLSF